MTDILTGDLDAGYLSDLPRGGRRGPKPQPREFVSAVSVVFKLKDSERALIQRAASRVGTSVSDICREGAILYAKFQIKSESGD